MQSFCSSSKTQVPSNLAFKACVTQELLTFPSFSTFMLFGSLPARPISSMFHMQNHCRKIISPLQTVPHLSPNSISGHHLRRKGARQKQTCSEICSVQNDVCTQRWNNLPVWREIESRQCFSNHLGRCQRTNMMPVFLTQLLAASCKTVKMSKSRQINLEVAILTPCRQYTCLRVLA